MRDQILNVKLLKNISNRVSFPLRESNSLDDFKPCSYRARYLYDPHAHARCSALTEAARRDGGNAISAAYSVGDQQAVDAGRIHPIWDEFVNYVQSHAPLMIRRVADEKLQRCVDNPREHYVSLPLDFSG